MEATGGAAPYVLTDANGDFVEQVDWKAPALNMVLYRYDEEEVREILVYGRPFSPMPAWGVEGNGPLDEQQIGDLIAYLDSIQLRGDELDAQLVAVADEVDRSIEEGEFASEGEALFNLGLNNGFAGGAFSCGRCHTPGWSYGQPGVAGGGASGPNLPNVEAQFPGGAAGFASQLDFITDRLRERHPVRRPGHGQWRDARPSGRCTPRTSSGPSWTTRGISRERRTVVSSVLAGIAFDPHIRGVLVVLVSVTVLIGGIWLILSTNLAARLGFLVTFTALFGWMTVMGGIWTAYGIGLVGERPAWTVTEVNVGDLAEAQLEEAQLAPQNDDLPDVGSPARGQPRRGRHLRRRGHRAPGRHRRRRPGPDPGGQRLVDHRCRRAGRAPDGRRGSIDRR